MGLDKGHPEKDGVLVNMSTLAEEVKSRLERKKADAVAAVIASEVDAGKDVVVDDAVIAKVEGLDLKEQ